MDGVDLIIHEAGHLLLTPFGHFAHMIGGTLLQILIPALFAWHFFKDGQSFSASLVLFWRGQSLLNVAVYASDAEAMRLPLLGGRDSIHDWNFLLVTFEILEYTEFVGALIRALGSSIVVLSAYLCVRYARISTSK